MHTKAVYRATRALNAAGFRTLRFNFRGVGYSTGTFDDGIGEEEDVIAAMDWLELGLPGRPIVVGGMSFGSMVGLKAGLEDARVVAMVAVGVPIHVYDYSYLAETDKPILVVQGELDEYGSGEEAAEVMGTLGDHVAIQRIPGAGHLLEDHLKELQEVIKDFFCNGPGSLAMDGPARISGGMGS
jgi:alpha/beta superfamily hydrolase